MKRLSKYILSLGLLFFIPIVLTAQETTTTEADTACFINDNSGAFTFLRRVGSQ